MWPVLDVHCALRQKRQQVRQYKAKKTTSGHTTIGQATNQPKGKKDDTMDDKRDLEWPGVWIDLKEKPLAKTTQQY